MKNSTKLKIIQWVTRRLGYKHPDIIPVKHETRKIQEVRWEGFLSPVDFSFNKRRIVGDRIGAEAERMGLIGVKTAPHPETGGVLVTAKAFFIEPIEKL